jgi:hypothetical protein
MKSNPAFLTEISAKLPPDAKVLVACQLGLRSLAACELLVRAGYKNVAWLSGGFEAAGKADFETTSGRDMRYGSVAGLRGIIGWTPVQQEDGSGIDFRGFMACLAAAAVAAKCVRVACATAAVQD